jgi:hypothetical protein
MLNVTNYPRTKTKKARLRWEDTPMLKFQLIGCVGGYI